MPGRRFPIQVLGPMASFGEPCIPIDGVKPPGELFVFVQPGIELLVAHHPGAILQAAGVTMVVNLF